MPDQPPEPTVLTIEQARDMGVKGIYFLYQVFVDLSKKYEAMKAEKERLESENKEMQKKLKRLEEARRLLDKFLDGTDGEAKDDPSD